MRYDVNPREISWRNRSGGGSFRPSGRMLLVGDRAALRGARRGNPRTFESEDTFSARIVVGFLPQDAPASASLTEAQSKRVLDDLVELVRRVRTAQVGDPGATFLAQRGLYRHIETGVVVDEPGAQVLIINTAEGVSPEQFEDQMEELAEVIARDLDQREVIVEIQRNGISQKVFGVEAQ